MVKGINDFFLLGICCLLYTKNNLDTWKLPLGKWNKDGARRTFLRFVMQFCFQLGYTQSVQFLQRSASFDCYHRAPLWQEQWRNDTYLWGERIGLAILVLRLVNKIKSDETNSSTLNRLTTGFVSKIKSDEINASALDRLTKIVWTSLRNKSDEINASTLYRLTKIVWTTKYNQTR